MRVKKKEISEDKGLLVSLKHESVINSVRWTQYSEKQKNVETPLLENLFKVINKYRCSRNMS